MINKIKINQLRVKGVNKDYFVNFKKGLNIISGEISTGKTTILDLIDYCFGEEEPPKYPEIYRKANIALLEIEIGEEKFIIERQMYSKRNTEQIHFCNMNEMSSDHRTIEVKTVQKKGEESISSFILSKIGLEEVPLKEAPKKDVSGIDIMSLRDVMWICYLKRDRVSGEDLLFEKNYMKEIKLKQVIDVIFNLHSEKLSILSGELKKNLESLIEKQQKEKTLLSFIDNQGIMTLEKLEEEKIKLLEGIENNKRLLEEINVKILGSSDLAKDLRENVLKLNSNIQSLRTDKRNIEKTLQRLIPLRGQYHEDISKLNFLSRAKQIIDPLTILFCPSCLSPIKKSETKDVCQLCGNKIKETEIYENLDVTREIRTIERKLDELNTYVEDIETRHKDIEKQEEKITNELKLESKKLDDTLQSFVSPFLTERDTMISIMSQNQNEIIHIDEMIKIRNDIKTISKERIDLQNKQEEIEKTIEEERKKSVNRAEVINSLSKTYFNHLQTVKFPKLSEAFIDDKLVPYVRGIRYNELSSDGAINLSSICWMTAIFAEAIQRSTHHPGFLMLDNIQAGIGIGAERDRDFQDETIVDGIYTLLKELSDPSNGGQLIVVDNHPPNYMKNGVIVYYSRDPKRPPYGFIDDETT